MPHHNSAQVIGRVLHKSDLVFVKSKVKPYREFAALNLKVWTRRTWRGKVTEQARIRVKVIGKAAETIDEMVRLGDYVFIEGRLKLDSFTDRNGHRRWVLYIMAHRFQFLWPPPRGRFLKDFALVPKDEYKRLRALVSETKLDSADPPEDVKKRYQLLDEEPPDIFRELDDPQ